MTKRIEKLSTTFRVASSYVKTQSGAEGIGMSTPKYNQTLGRTIYPYYYYTEGHFPCCGPPEALRQATKVQVRQPGS